MFFAHMSLAGKSPSLSSVCWLWFKMNPSVYEKENHTVTIKTGISKPFGVCEICLCCTASGSVN